MQFTQYSPGHRKSGEIIQINLSGSAANVRLMDASNFQNYKSSSGLRFPSMKQPSRAELAGQVRTLQYTTRREIDGNPDFVIHSFVVIGDLRPREPVEE